MKKPIPVKDNVRMSISLPRSLGDMLENESKRTGQSKSEIIRCVLYYYFLECGVREERDQNV